MFTFIDKWAENIYNYFNSGSTKVETVIEKATKDIQNTYYSSNYDTQLLMAQQQANANQQIYARMMNAQAQKTSNAYRTGQTLRRPLPSLNGELNWEYVEILSIDKNGNYTVNIHNITYSPDHTKTCQSQSKIVDPIVFDSYNYTPLNSFQFLNDITVNRSF